MILDKKIFSSHLIVDSVCIYIYIYYFILFYLEESIFKTILLNKSCEKH